MVASQNVTKMRISERHERAAAMVAADDLNDEEIAATVGISRRVLARWKLHPDFDALVQAHLDVFRRRVESRGIADRHRRVASQDERWRKLQQVIAERAADTASGTFVDELGEDRVVAGWGTGLLVRQEKPHGIEFAVDTGLLKEMRELEKHAATELGQWSEKSELSVSIETLAREIAAAEGRSIDDVLPELLDLQSERKKRRAA